MASSVLLFIICLYAVIHFHSDFKSDPAAYMKDLERLAKRYRESDSVKKFGVSPILMVFFMFDERRLDTILDSGLIGVNHLSDKGYAALHFAAFVGKLDVIRLLDKHGADLDIRAPDGSTALLLAVSQNHSEVVRYLIDTGCDTEIADNDGVTPLAKAIRSHFLQIAEIFLENKINRKVPDALHVAAEMGHLMAGRHLIKLGYDVNRPLLGESPLHVAVRHGKISFVKLLLAADADCNLLNDDGASALHIAVLARSVKMVHVLLHANCDLNVRNASRLTPLQLAVNSRFIRIGRIIQQIAVNGAKTASVVLK